jgi:hypothetical protein
MRETISMGIALALAVLAAIVGAFVWIAVPLLALAVFLFAWALEPTRTEAFVGRLPYSNYSLKVLATITLTQQTCVVQRQCAASLILPEQSPRWSGRIRPVFRSTGS